MVFLWFSYVGWDPIETSPLDGPRDSPGCWHLSPRLFAGISSDTSPPEVTGVQTFSGWWLSPLSPLKNDGVVVSWDDVPFPIWWESHNPVMFQSPPTSYQNSRISHFSIFSLGMAIPCTKSHHSAMDLQRFFALNVRSCVPSKSRFLGRYVQGFPQNISELMLKPYYYTHQCWY